MIERFDLVPRGRPRGPQIADGVFEGYLESSTSGTPARPVFFTAMLWSQGPPPGGTELWCYRTAGGAAPKKWPAAGLAGDNRLWLEKIAPSSDFSPPDPQNPTLAAHEFKEYASSKWAAKYGPGSDTATNWKFIGARPFQSPFGSDVQKQRNKVYAVKQHPISGGQFLTSWLWVPASGGREVWLHYLPGQPGGFQYAGSTSALGSTQLLFEEYTDVDDLNLWKLSNYAATIDRFKDWALAHTECPAFQKAELELADYRLTDQV